jgi:hypothetical protein
MKKLVLLTLAVLAMPPSAQAQGSNEGAPAGNRAPDPVGGAVNAIVGGASPRIGCAVSTQISLLSLRGIVRCWHLATCQFIRRMSAFGGKADSPIHGHHVRL